MVGAWLNIKLSVLFCFIKSNTTVSNGVCSCHSINVSTNKQLDLILSELHMYWNSKQTLMFLQDFTIEISNISFHYRFQENKKKGWAIDFKAPVIRRMGESKFIHSFIKRKTLKKKVNDAVLRCSIGLQSRKIY